MAIQTRRREFIITVGSAVAAWPLAARAQQAGPLRRIGFLFGAIPPDQFGSGRGFTQGMRELGYLEGKDFVVEWRSAEGHYEPLLGVRVGLKERTRAFAPNTLNSQRDALNYVPEMQSPALSQGAT